MSKSFKIAGIASILVLVGILVFGAVSFAQDPSGQGLVDGFRQATGLGQGRGFGPHGMGGPGRGHRGGPPVQLDGLKEHMDATLAEALGLTVEELQAARAEGQRMNDLAEAQGVDLETLKATMDAALTTYVDQAVADGLITAEEAEMIKNHKHGGMGKGPGMHGPGPLAEVEGAKEIMDAAIANALGMTVEEVAAAQAEGQTLRDLAEQQGLTREDIKAAKDAAFEETLAKGVADGVFTQEEADAIRERKESRGDCPGGGRGHRGGHRGGPGAGFGLEGFGPQDGFAPDNTETIQ